MTTRPARRASLVLFALCLAGLAGCKTESTASTSQWATSPDPGIRTAVGDSLGNALFLRDVQLAKSAQFQHAPTYAAETTD